MFTLMEVPDQVKVQDEIVVLPYMRYKVVVPASAPNERTVTLAEEPAANEVPEVSVMEINLFMMETYTVLL